MPFARARARRVAPVAPAVGRRADSRGPGTRRGLAERGRTRPLARPPVYRLPREEVGVLGVEGDCLLGWRAGDAILSDLG